MRLVNLCPHPVTILAPGETIVLPEAAIPLRLPSEGAVSPDTALPVVRVSLPSPEALPPPQPDVLYVVSTPVRLAHPTRGDLASPRDVLKDSAGRPYACRALSVNDVES